MSEVSTVLNEGPAVDRLLEAVVPQLREGDEVVVVDGGSSDDTASRLRRWARGDPRVRLVVAGGTNISEGRNRGVAEARHDLLAFTDAGCVPEPGWLDALRAAFMEEPPPSLVTGTFRAAAGTPWEAAMAVTGYRDPEEARAPSPLLPPVAAFMGWVWDPTLPTGRSMAVSREAWEAAGGFPERMATGEDVTFGRHVAASGRRVVLSAGAEVTWHQRPTVGSTARMFYRYGIGSGLSGDSTLVGRDLARAAAYAGATFLAWRGGRTARLAVGAGALFHLWRPLLRAARRPRPAAVAALSPFAIALKDVSKAAGCIRGLLARWGIAPIERHPAPPAAVPASAPRPVPSRGSSPAAPGTRPLSGDPGRETADPRPSR